MMISCDKSSIVSFNKTNNNEVQQIVYEK